MLCTSDGYVNAVILLNEGTWICTHHRDKNDIEFTTLRTIYGDHLLLHALGRVHVSDNVLLRVVRRDDVNPAFLETLL